MKRFFLAFSAVAITMLALNTQAHAQDAALDVATDELSFDAAAELNTYDVDARIELIRPGGPGWGPGHGPGHGPGWGPGHGPGHGPGWGPGPGPMPPPPPPPPAYQHPEILTCSSVGYRYAECYFDPRGIQSIALSRQLSHSQCEYGRSYGIDYDRIWVHKGCRAEFTIQRRGHR